MKGITKVAEIHSKVDMDVCTKVVEIFNIQIIWINNSGTLVCINHHARDFLPLLFIVLLTE